MTRPRWLDMLQAYANGENVRCEDYGALLKVDFDFSSITREEVKALLERLGR